MGKRRIFVFWGILFGFLLLGSCGLIVYFSYLPGVYSSRVACFFHGFRTKALDFEGPFLELDHFEYLGPTICSERYKVFYRLKQSSEALVSQLRRDYPNKEWVTFGGTHSEKKGGGFDLSMRNSSETVEITLTYAVHPFKKTPEFVVVVDEHLPPPPSTH